MLPIVKPVLNIGIVAKNCNINALAFLEQWCNTIYVDCDYNSYITVEQENTKFNLNERIKSIEHNTNNDVIVELDCNKITQEDIKIITNLGEIICENNDIGKFSVENLLITVNKIDDKAKELIFIDNND